MPEGSEFQTEGAAMLKPREAKVVWTRGTDNRLCWRSIEKRIMIIICFKSYCSHTGNEMSASNSPGMLSLWLMQVSGVQAVVLYGYRVMACPVRMLKKNNQEDNWLRQIAEKWPLKWYTCVHV